MEDPSSVPAATNCVVPVVMSMALLFASVTKEPVAEVLNA